MELNLKMCRTAAALCSAAIHEVVPGSDLLGGGETENGFFYQFYFPKTISSDIAVLLEEKMRQIVRENRAVKAMDMVACSARELFQKAYHEAAVAALEEMEPKELVSIIRIGDFCDLADGPFCSSVREVGAFQITSVKPMGEGEFRVEGCVASSKDELKSFLRTLRKYSEENHLTLGNELGLWENDEGGLVWLEKGLFARSALVAFLKKNLAPEAIEVGAVSDPHLRRYCEKIFAKEKKGFFWTSQLIFADPEGESGLFEECCQSPIEQTIYLSSSEIRSGLFSLLQSIHKTLIILGFHPDVCLCGRKLGEKSLKLLEQELLKAGLTARFEMDEHSTPRVRWMVRDGLGRPRVAAELRVETTLSLKLSVERILALLLEQTLGNLPDWLTHKKH